MRLRDAKTTEQVCRLECDNWSYGDYWILSDGYNVTVTHQKKGESPKAGVTVPRHIFNRLIDFYQKEQGEGE